MVRRLAAVVVLAWDLTQRHAECDWRRHCLTREPHAGAGGVGTGPIADPTVESQAPASTEQKESSSSPPDVAPPTPTQNPQDEQMDSPMELDTQEHRERKEARPSETPASDSSGRPLVKARPALPPMIVPTAEGSGTVVLSTPASSSKDEMMIGGLFVIDGIDVVATFVPEEDVAR